MDQPSSRFRSTRQKTIKVWEAVLNFRPHVESEWEQFDKTVDSEDSDEEDEAEKWWRNKVTGHEPAMSKPQSHLHGGARRH
jgi:hypothetical protein